MGSLADVQVTDNVTDVLAAQYNALIGSNLLASWSNVTSMSGTVALVDGDYAIQRFNCNGANRTVNLPAYATTNHPFLIVNATGADFAITLTDSAGTQERFPTLYDGDSVLVAPDGAAGYKLVQPGELKLYKYSAAASGFPFLNGRRARGYKASPAAVQTDDSLMRFGGGGHNGTSMSNNTAALDFVAAENWDGTHFGTYIKASTSPKGAGGLSESFRLTAAGIPRWTKATKRVTTQFDKANNTLGDVTGLAISLEASGVYAVRAVLFTSSNASYGVKCSLGTSDTLTATAIRFYGTIYDAGAFQAAGTGVATALGTAVADKTAVTAAMLVIEGYINVNAAGTLTVQFAQNSTNATVSSVLVGSYLTVEDMA